MKLVYYIFLFIFTVLLIILISDYRNIKKNIVILEEVPKKEDFGLNVKFEQKIPLKIYKTHKKDVIKNFKKEIDITTKNNSNFEHFFFTDEECIKFVRNNYNNRIYNAFISINKNYGACRADLFRYLLIYKKGGLYLDIKSVITDNIENILEKNKGKLLVHRTVPFFGPFCSYFSLKSEFNQWSITSPPGHPLLKKIIEKIIYNIELEKKRKIKKFKGPWGVISLTGPFIFTDMVNKNRKNVSYLYPNFNFKMKKSIENYKKKYKSYWDINENLIH